MTKSTIAVALLVAIATAACGSGMDPTGSGQAELGKGGASGSDPKDPGATDWCFEDAVSASSCTPTSALYAKAAAACAAANGAIQSFDVGAGCAKGEGTDAKYRCCAAPPPPSDPCFTLSVGDEKTCRSDSELEVLAQTECGAQKAKMTTMVPDYACPSASIEGKSHAAKVECCTQ